jgi:DNA helicase-2/ATP-dependent DNA helicase PcrA
MLTRLAGHAADQRARHVDRHLPRPVQPLAARALEAMPACRRLFQILDTADQLSAVKRLLKRSTSMTRSSRPSRCATSSTRRRSRACAPARSKPGTTGRKKVEIYEPTRRSASAKAWSISPSCCCAPTSCCATTSRCASTTSERFRHILVDEFQDTNKLQYAWLKLLAGGQAPTCSASGDDDQSIYAFRGADVGNMADFEREFRCEPDPPGAELPLPRQHPRRRQRHHQATTPRLGKNLWTEAGSGEPMRIYESYQRRRRGALDRRGGQGSCSATATPRRDRPALPQQRAVAGAGTRAVQCRPALPRVWRPALLRARRDQARAGLPAPDRQPDDDTSFLRVVNFPARGIGARSLEQLQDAAKAANSSLHAAIPQVAGAGGAKLAAFAQLIVTCAMPPPAAAGTGRPRARTVRPAQPTTRTRRKARSGWTTSTN